METDKKITSFTNTLGFKILLVFFIGLLLLIPMALVENVVNDRQYYQNDALDSIIAPIGGDFSLYGVMIAIPYYYYETIETSGSKQTVRKNDHILIMPSEYSLNGTMQTEMLSRGIFKTPVFYSDMNVKVQFDQYDLDSQFHYDTVSWDKAVLIVAAGNRQNYKELPNIQVNGNELELYETAQFSSVDILSNSFVYLLDRQLVEQGFAGDIAMSIQGGKSMHFLPMAGSNNIQLSSNWADVGFTGSWLASNRQITDEGFSAQWQVAGFNTPLYGVRSLEELNRVHISNSKTINTSFLLLNDNYVRTDRSIKYAMLFIFIPFFALFLCELLTKKRIHAVQYALIGLTNVIFYMLLLSISEHLSFNISYVMSAIAVIVATALYVWAITRTKKLGLVIAIVEVLIYAFLFGILQLTDFALLFGTIGLFIAVATAMYFTRNIEFNSAE